MKDIKVAMIPMVLVYEQVFKGKSCRLYVQQDDLNTLLESLSLLHLVTLLQTVDIRFLNSQKLGMMGHALQTHTCTYIPSPMLFLSDAF